MGTDADRRPGAESVRLRKSHREDGGWELFAHDSEIGVRGFGSSREMAFEEVAYALTSVITDAATIEQKELVDFVCNAPDDDRLLHQWLNAIVAEMAARDMLFSRYSVQIREHGLTGKAWGEKRDPQKHRPVVEVKGATTVELEVARDSDGVWLAQCVVDV